MCLFKLYALSKFASFLRECLFYLVPYVLLTVSAQILVVPNNDNNNNNNNEYSYRIALQCKSTVIKGVLVPCSLLYPPISVSFVKIKGDHFQAYIPVENPCEETGHRCPYFESLSFALLDATAYAMAPNTHTERTVTPTSSPLAIAEYIAALTRVLMMWVGHIAEQRANGNSASDTEILRHGEIRDHGFREKMLQQLCQKIGKLNETYL